MGRNICERRRLQMAGWLLRLAHPPPRVFQMEEEPFNPDYVDVDRVLEVSYCEDKDSGEVKRTSIQPLHVSPPLTHFALFIFFWIFFSESILHASAALCVCASAQGRGDGLPGSLCR